jgi:Ca2+-binding RTX toxin-like protein
MATINGDNQDNVLTGTNLADTINGFDGHDVLIGLNGNDILNGGLGDDELFGQAGNDILSGGAGADSMNGGAGNDIYIVDNAGDVVTEIAGGGIDRIQSSISLSLNVSGRFDVENLTLTGSSAINGFDNALSNVLTGNNAVNTLTARGGNDSLFGMGGDDFLSGGTGSDSLNGGTGADAMSGEAGNDNYVVDNVGDTIIEASGGGVDKILSSISMNLSVGALLNVENLTLSGASSLNGTGNASSNVLVGNNADNVLAGLGGSDQISGLGGNDSLDGGTGNDTLNGGAGNDSIITGTGTDRVVFNTALGAGNIDQVQDFSHTFDTFLLENAIFTALAPGVLPAAAFVIGAAAADADDRIIYDSASGALSYDADGVGGAAQTQFALLASGLALTNDDFSVI